MSATNGKQSSGPRARQSVARGFIVFLRSVRLAIILLSFIAVASIIGTVIKQQAPPEEYLSRFSATTFAVVQGLSLDDVFHSWWFLFAVVVFALNLILCTFDRFVLLLKSLASKTFPKESSLTALELTFFHEEANIDELVPHIGGYRSVSRIHDGVILEKGRYSRYGFVVIHCSVLLILLGSLVGLWFGFKGSLALSPGESKDTITPGDTGGIPRPLGFTVRCADFKVDFYNNGQPKDFVSSLEVLEDGRVVVKKDVRVNDPLTYKGISFYQATYGDNRIFQFQIDGRSVDLNEGGTFQYGGLVLMVVRYAETVHDLGPGVQVAYLDESEPKAVWFLRDVPRLREQIILGFPIRLQDIKQHRYTGLEVSRDPGLWLVWCGFLLMLCGLYLNFGSYHRRIYLLSKDGGIIVAGMSRKNREVFKREFQRLKERLNAKR